MSDITIEEFKKIEGSGDCVLIDVREEWEFEEFNIGGILMPLSTIPFRYEELRSHSNKTIIVHCQSGNRSNQARIYLSRRGFQNVKSLSGGVIAYKEHEGITL
jgi:rhodanese-related sulfurtransferase